MNTTVYKSYWYAIYRNSYEKLETKVIFNSEYDPLYGYGTWNMIGGPFDSYEKAIAEADKFEDNYKK